MSAQKFYDLEERVSIFSEKLIIFCRMQKINTISKPLIDQLIRSGTSIGANYMEANGASSKKDFKNKIFICKKKAKESLYWLRLISGVIANETDKSSYNLIRQEAHELVLIFSKISSSLGGV